MAIVKKKHNQTEAEVNKSIEEVKNEVDALDEALEEKPKYHSECIKKVSILLQKKKLWWKKGKINWGNIEICPMSSEGVEEIHHSKLIDAIEIDIKETIRKDYDTVIKLINGFIRKKKEKFKESKLKEQIEEKNKYKIKESELLKVIENDEDILAIYNLIKANNLEERDSEGNLNSLEKLLYKDLYYIDQKDILDKFTIVSKNASSMGSTYSKKEIVKDKQTLNLRKAANYNYLKKLKHLINFAKDNPEYFLHDRFLGDFYAFSKEIKDTTETVPCWSLNGPALEGSLLTRRFLLNDLYEQTFPYFIQSREHKIDDLKPFTNDINTPAYSYFNLDKISELDPNLPTPKFDEFITHFNNNEAEIFKAYVYSIFDEKSNGRQMLYFTDPGRTGKSALIKALEMFLGKEVVGELDTNKLGKNNFLLESVYDKRLITIDENSKENLLYDDTVKKLTSGGTISVECKGKAIFDYDSSCKIIGAGNIPLNISNDPHIYSRVIQLELKPYSEEILKRNYKVDENGDVIYTKNPRTGQMDPEPISTKNALAEDFKEEFENFLRKCKISYDKLTTRDKKGYTNSITIDSETQNKMFGNVSEDELELNEFFDRCIEFTKNDYTPRNIVANTIDEYIEEYNVKNKFFKKNIMHRIKSYNGEFGKVELSSPTPTSSGKGKAMIDKYPELQGIKSVILLKGVKIIKRKNSIIESLEKLNDEEIENELDAITSDEDIFNLND